LFDQLPSHETERTVSSESYYRVGGEQVCDAWIDDDSTTLDIFGVNVVRYFESKRKKTRGCRKTIIAEFRTDYSVVEHLNSQYPRAKNVVVSRRIRSNDIRARVFRRNEICLRRYTRV